MTFTQSPETKAFMDYMDAEYAKWAAEHADQIAEEHYQDWAAIRREDGEDSSRAAYETYLDSLLPDD